MNFDLNQTQNNKRGSMAVKNIITVCATTVFVVAVICGCGTETPDIEMVFVEGGTFTMGCTPEQGNDCRIHTDELFIAAFGREPEKPTHSVTVVNFSIGKYEVTQKQWKQIMGNNPSFFKGDDFPVESVTRIDVQKFLLRLNKRTGQNYRLPTEAEWEYAARGGNKSNGYKYSGSNNIDEVAWYYGNAGDKVLDDEIWDLDRAGSNRNRPHSVGTKTPNELGIHDMSGNVWERVNDWHSAYTPETKINPTGPSSGIYSVDRGGCWVARASNCRVSFRGGCTPDYRDNTLGFRIVLSSP
jgi:formylglycine-generating enzyme required for sulfatase activity